MADRVRLDRDPHGGVTVVVEGTPQSYVQPDDPLLLVFEYVQHFALVVGSLPAGPLAVTHVGGAGLTFPRWVEATRPGSPQIVLEPDVELTEIVRRELPLPRRHRIRVRPVDGVTGMRALGGASADVVVVDAYARGRVPAELTTVEYLTDVRRVLRPSGVVMLNIADQPVRRFLGRVLATVTAAGYADRLVVATFEVLRGRRFGNSVVVAGSTPLDADSVRRSVSRMAVPAGVRHGADVERMVSGARPLTDAEAEESPAPPDPGRWHLR
ncbi:MAG TPA: fused MFS/spermidine synthase [Lapillicoccus sp.]|nr:fused MFS/spermidine synthase [Lapillicoccus sp.]